MSKIAQNLSLVSFLTMASRVLGLARDTLFFSFFGASVIGEAFLLAFTLPNLFRRMLGEGTLSSAFIPVFAETKAKKSLRAAQTLMNKVVSRLIVSLAFLSFLVVLSSYFGVVGNWFSSEKWIWGAVFNGISFSYVIFICSSAILIGALNTKGSFFAGAFSPTILNLMIISTLGILGFGMGLEEKKLAIGLSISVLLAGSLQFLLPFFQLRITEGWRWKMDLAGSEEMDKIRSLFWVGALGAAISQINVLISRFLAYSLDEPGGVSYLFLSSRLIELPLGVFAIAVSTVLFPELAKKARVADHSQFMESFFYGLRMILIITMPAAVGLALLAEPILSVLFKWGQFGHREVMEAVPVLTVSCLGLPLYAISAFMIKAFHSQKQMVHPLRAALISLVSNLILSLLLMGEFGVIGLAFANVLAAFLQTVFLIVMTKGFGFYELFKIRPLYFLPILSSSALMAIVLVLLSDWMQLPQNKASKILELLIQIPVGILIYCLSAYLIGLPELKKLYRTIVVFSSRDKDR